MVCARRRRYASELTDAEWRLIEPFMPPVKRLGGPRVTPFGASAARERSPAARWSCLRGGAQQRVDAITGRVEHAKRY